MNLWVWVKRVFKLLGLLFSALLLAFVAVNWHDEAPTPLALEMGKTAREQRTNTVPDQENAYLYMLGFAAPEGVDPVQEGRRLVTIHNAVLGASSSYPKNFKIEELQINALKLQGSPIIRCQRVHAPCKPNLADSDIAHNQQLLKDNVELVRRYDDLQCLPSYHTMRTPSLEATPLTSTTPLIETHYLVQNIAWHALAQANFDAVINFAERDIALWRMVLAGHGALIDDLQVLAHIEANLHMLATLLAQPQFDAAAYASRLHPMLRPFTPAEYALSTTFTQEFLFSQNLIGDMVQGKGLFTDASWADFGRHPVLLWRTLGSLGFHPQAMKNRSAAQKNALIQLAQLKPADFAQNGAAIHQKLLAQALPHFKFLDLNWLYDPAGKFITNTRSDAFLYSIASVHNRVTYLNLVRAQLELRLNPQAHGQEAAFLQAHSDWYNPYTEAPFDWDANTRSLSFTGLAEGDETEAALPVFRVFLP